MKHLLSCCWLLAGLLLAAWPARAQTSLALPATSFWAQHVVLASLLASTVGFGLGAWLMRRWARKHYHAAIHRARHQARQEGEHAASLKTVKTVKPPTDYEMKLREENTALTDRVSALTKQLAATRSPTDAPPSAVEVTAAGLAAAPPLPAEVSAAGPADLASLPAEETNSDAATTARYAPAQETGFLRDSKLATEPLPQLPILVTLDSAADDKAAFTLSPHVNQAKLIGDGLHQLSEFFDFDLPTGRIAAVSADAPGQLARQGDGWQVVRRARLLVH